MTVLTVIRTRAAARADGLVSLSRVELAPEQGLLVSVLSVMPCPGMTRREALSAALPGPAAGSQVNF